MAAMYGHTWASQYGTQPVGIAADTWGAALAGLSGSDLATGLQACIAEGAEWPPSAPRFRCMCLGIPSFEAVQNQLTRLPEERSPFAVMTWGLLDTYAYRQAGGREAVAMLRAAYERAKEQRMHGTPLPVVAAKLEAPEQQPLQVATPAQRERHFADIRAALGLSDSEAEAMGGEGLERAMGERS